MRTSANVCVISWDGFPSIGSVNISLSIHMN